MKVYFKILGLIVFFVIVFGIAGPFLISAASTELVAIGVALIALIGVPVAFFTCKSIMEDLTFTPTEKDK